MLRRGKKIEKFHRILNGLATGNPLPPKYKDHAMKGAWTGYRDCHIEDDWVLIYRIDKSELTLIATRTGTHSDLNL
jgi:mRNA interferase YafQ